MGRGRVHTLFRRGRWLVEVEDGGVRSSHASQSEAVIAGEKEAARLRTDHLIHREDGLIVEERRAAATELAA